MSNSTSRVVIDTNIWISFLIGKSLKSLLPKIIDKKVQLLFSHESLEELVNVLHRPKLQKYFSSSQVSELLLLINQLAEVIEVKSKVDACRDPKDNFLLALCLDGKADYLVTGDEDLLVLEEFHNTTIQNYQAFKLL